MTGNAEYQRRLAVAIEKAQAGDVLDLWQRVKTQTANIFVTALTGQETTMGTPDEYREHAAELWQVLVGALPMAPLEAFEIIEREINTEIRGRVDWVGVINLNGWHIHGETAKHWFDVADDAETWARRLQAHEEGIWLWGERLTELQQVKRDEIKRRSAR